MVLRVALLLMRPELDDATSVEMFLDSLHVESQKSMELYIIENIIAKTENLAMDFKNVLDLENLSHKYGNVYADPYFVGAFKMVPEGTMRRTIGDQRFNLHTIGYNPEAPHEYGYLLTQLQFQAWHVGKYSCARLERNTCPRTVRFACSCPQGSMLFGFVQRPHSPHHAGEVSHQYWMYPHSHRP